MDKYAIIIIKKKDKYLQYYDKRWDCYLFLNCKLYESISPSVIKSYVAEILKISQSTITSRFITNIKHSKYSVSAGKEKEYDHYFYEVKVDLKEEDFVKKEIQYKWFTYEEMKNDKRIWEVNQDIVTYVHDFNLE